MKYIARYGFFLFLFLILSGVTFSQSVAINADSSVADASAILDLKSTKKGLLIPRMTLTQRNFISSPAAGLLIYQTDNTAGYYYYTGSLWTPLKSTNSTGSGNYWSLNDGDDIFNTNIGNVGIGTVRPTSKLMVKTPLNTTGFKHLGITDGIGSDSIVVTENIGGVSASIGTATPHPFRFITNNTGRMTIDSSGNVIVGNNSAPAVAKFTVQTDSYSDGIVHRGTTGTTIGTFVGAGYARLFTNSDLDIQANTNGAGLHINGSNEYIGVGTFSPINKFQIGDMGSAGFNGNDLAIGNGTNAFAIAQGNSVTQISSSTNIGFIPKNGSGNVGINELNPINKLQIGSMGAAGFNGNDLAIGNGLQATGMAQTGSAFQIASTANIALLPTYGSIGRVGINTTIPKATLDVEGGNPLQSPRADNGFAYYGAKNSSNFYVEEDFGGTYDIPNVSIFASNNVMALQFDAFSDARIKSIGNVSNTKSDLQILNKIQVTDYVFKDKIRYGSKPSKKVIAQQVEQIYPQVVSRHKDVVPNVYQLTSNIEKRNNDYLLTFSSNHNINSLAKRLQVVMNDNTGKQYFDIVSIPSATQVVIRASDLKTDQLFVYGEEVDDFRTVDYEGLTTLNISATQELSKQVNELQKTVAEQNEQIESLLKAVQALKQPEITKR